MAATPTMAANKARENRTIEPDGIDSPQLAAALDPGHNVFQHARPILCDQQSKSARNDRSGDQRRKIDMARRETADDCKDQQSQYVIDHCGRQNYLTRPLMKPPV